ncbi:MAG TPA: hypothetical protein VNB94_12890, partial [Mycobacteriales bacterium]|nr:hypothetical protein [Mycobacteriales bacterium]
TRVGDGARAEATGPADAEVGAAAGVDRDGEAAAVGRALVRVGEGAGRGEALVGDGLGGGGACRITTEPLIELPWTVQK